ncbi:hypothetical protein GQ44DRAFT_776835 [Phaeosphaeriaceae sp. PMI808]|nr:hypothetical protein GQ44DRAFT_776835 [Phaeosphaeriaceae sp. PMI808]
MWDSPPPITRPWTPPETEVESSPRSDYFSDPFRPPSRYSPQMVPRCDTPTEACTHSRPKAVGRITEPTPYTPTKNPNFGDPNINGALQYPYTPDSSRILRRSTELASSPPPWDECSDYSEHHSTSPIQNALSSCITHFENLIQSQQPDEDQMEFIVRQFEAMTSYLSAPDAQTRITDDHLFSEPESSPGMRLGVLGVEDSRLSKKDYMSKAAHEAYVSQVGSYIEGVKKYIQDLKMRLDEVKTLNSIQLDVINDLRRQMKTVRRDMRSSLDMRDDVKLVEEELERIAEAQAQAQAQALQESAAKPRKEFGLDSWETLVDPLGQSNIKEKGHDASTQTPEPTSRTRRRYITIIRKPEHRSFWVSIGQALDSIGELLFEQ